MIDRVDHDLNEYFKKQEAAEEKFQELYELTDARTYDIIDELKELVKELESYDYGFDCKEIVLEAIKNGL